jgi:hypothetical protein
LFRKSAIVTLGRPRLAGGRWTTRIEWRAASAAPLFPVFVGRIIVDVGRIELDGFYAPPFGVVGYLLDRAILGVAARRTAWWFLQRVASALA